MGTLAAGIKDIFSTAKTTGTNVMLSRNDGTPDGNITMANLASVIGGMIIRPQQIESFDIDVAQQLLCGIYQTKEPSTGFPTTNYGTLIVFLGANGFKTFMWIDQRSGKLYYRSNWSASFKSNWLEISTDIPSFYKNYNDLASLASSMGIVYKDFNGAVVDLNSLSESKKIVYAGVRGAASGSSGFPDSSTNGNFVSFGTSAGFIEFFQTAANTLYLRMKWGGGGYTSWRQL